MLIHRMADALSWVCGAADFDAVEHAYLRRLSQAWERRADPRLVALGEQGGRASFERFLAAPETSYRLLWSSVDPAEAQRFFEASLCAELALAGQPVTLRAQTWTALGDAAVGPGNARFVFPQQPGMMPLDFGSPRARRIDLSGRELETAVVREPYSAPDLEAAVCKVRQALRGVLDACPQAGRFIARFNKVLVIQPDPSAPQISSSGSNGQLIGRSWVTNVQSPHVTIEAVADAVVHEGIHGLLYMQQVMQPWGAPDTMRDQTPVIESPWTRRMLPLRSFLEACFVWYGLLHLWCHALDVDAFEPGAVRYHLTRALRGFLRQPLPELVEAHRERLVPALLDAVADLQRQVQAAFAS